MADAMAMQLLVPGPQPEITGAQRREIEAVLAGVKIEDPKNCLNPACGGKTTWVMERYGPENWSRCVRCGYLKSFGRTWHSIRDLLQGEIRRNMSKTLGILRAV